MNQEQYHQAHQTPFGSGPLAHLVGRAGDTAVAKSLILGQLPPSLPNKLLHETIWILQTLAKPYPP